MATQKISNVSAYEKINQQIISMLEQGDIPWLDPQRLNTRSFVSYVTDKPYSLLNCLLLKKPGFYITFEHAKDLNGMVKKGAKGTCISFGKWETKKAKENDEEQSDDENDEVDPNIQKAIDRMNGTAVIKTGNEEKYWMFRYYYVFNVQDVSGLPAKPTEHLEIKNNKAISNVEDMICRYLANEKLKLKMCDSMFHDYNHLTDTITISPITKYGNSVDYYKDLLRDVVSSTGNMHRVNRNTLQGADKAFHPYDRVCEELTCEIGSLYLCAALGIDTKDVYQYSEHQISEWVSRMKDYNKLFVQACNSAEKAARYVLNSAFKNNPIINS